MRRLRRHPRPAARELAATASDESLEVEPLKVYRDITLPDEQDATIDAAHAAALPASRDNRGAGGARVGAGGRLPPRGNLR